MYGEKFNQHISLYWQDPHDKNTFQPPWEKKQTFAAPPVTHFFFCLTLCVIDPFRATFHHLPSWNPGGCTCTVSTHTYTHIQPFLSAWPACVLSPPSGDLGVVGNPSRSQLILLLNFKNSQKLSYKLLTWCRWYTLPVRLSFLPTPSHHTTCPRSATPAYLYVRVCMSAWLSWRVWVIWYARMLVCVPPVRSLSKSSYSKSICHAAGDSWSPPPSEH